MKLRIILPLLLLTVTLIAPFCTMRAQTNKDWVYITNNPFDLNGWRLSFHHFGPNTTPVTAITLTLDTTEFPNVRFDGSTGDAGPDSAQYGWFFNSSVNGDSNWWCNSSGNSILHNQSDSFFVFGLQPNPNNPNAQIYDSAVTIHWTASFGSNDCTRYSPISSGTFQVIPTIFQSFIPYDTMTATSTTPQCDPIFNFTVYNRSGFQANIGTVTIELLDIFNGTMRPSDVMAPPGWKLDSVTPYTATFSGGNNIITHGASQGNFIVGLMADSKSTTFDFALHTYDYQGTQIDRDSTWGIPGKALDCSDRNTSNDTLRITNNLDCAFNFNLENSHVGNVPVSPIDKFLLHITTPGVTWSSASNPAPCWSNIGVGTATLSFQTPSCAQPGGITQTYHASIDDPTPGELVSVDWIDSNGTVETSRGTDTFRCVAPQTPDSVFVDALGSCGYRVRVKNAHANPTSSIHAVLFELPGTAGAFAPSGVSSNANWGYSFGTGDSSLQFTAGNTLLAPGATDTFYFSTDPKQPNTPWTLTFLDYEASGNTITNLSVNNIPGCTPPVVLDSVFHNIDQSNCTDTIRVINRGSSSIDTIEVMPAAGVSVANATIAIPWSKSIVGNGAILTSPAGLSPQLPLTFIVSYNGETSNALFNVEVRTLHTSSRPLDGGASINDSMLSCSVSGVSSSQTIAAPLTLSIAPNPMRDQTDITLTTGTLDRVRMVLLNVLGQTAQTVVDQMLSAGDHKFTLDATTLPAGTYYLRLETNGQVMTKKLVIEK